MASDETAARRRQAVRKLLGRIDYERGSTLPDLSVGLKLDRMHQLLLRLGQPQRALRCVHVAGTKGKGSTSAMLASILKAADLRVGLYTSPHLENLEQRFQINGIPCTEADLTWLIESIWPHVEAMDDLAGGSASGPTYFEITTAAAMVYFREQQVDLAVLEVGLGGRLDSTNLCLPDLCVVTNISFDHTRQLGNALDQIAREKAGIIKPGIPVVSGVQAELPRGAIREIAEWRGCRLVERGEDFDIVRPGDQAEAKHSTPGTPRANCFDFRSANNGSECVLPSLSTSLLGWHQANNAALAVAAALELRNQGWAISDEAIRTGLATTSCPARVEVCGRRPTVVLDAAHNVASIEALLATLKESFEPAKRWLLFATTHEKDVAGMLERLLPEFDEILLTRYVNSPRAVSETELVTIARGLSKKTPQAFSDPQQAWAAVQEQAAENDLICVTGSFFLAAELRPHIVGRKTAMGTP